jgi:hypothetical protein
LAASIASDGGRGFQGVSVFYHRPHHLHREAGCRRLRQQHPGEDRSGTTSGKKYTIHDNNTGAVLPDEVYDNLAITAIDAAPSPPRTSSPQS